MLFSDQQISISSYEKLLIFLIQQNCLNRFYFAINRAIFSGFKFCVQLENFASQHNTGIIGESCEAGSLL